MKGFFEFDALDCLLVRVMLVAFMTVLVISKIRVIQGAGDRVKRRSRRLYSSPKIYPPPSSGNVSKLYGPGPNVPKPQEGFPGSYVDEYW